MQPNLEAKSIGRSNELDILLFNFKNNNSLQRDTVSYWLKFVQKCSNWRWWVAILDLIDLYQSLNRLLICNSQNCSMFPLAFVAGSLQGH